MADATDKRLLNFKRKQMFLDFVVVISDVNSPLDQSFNNYFRRNMIDPDVPKVSLVLVQKNAGKAGGVKASRDILRKRELMLLQS